MMFRARPLPNRKKDAQLWETLEAISSRIKTKANLSSHPLLSAFKLSRLDCKRILEISKESLLWRNSCIWQMKAPLEWVILARCGWSSTSLATKNRALSHSCSSNNKMEMPLMSITISRVPISKLLHRSPVCLHCIRILTSHWVLQPTSWSPLET